MQIVDGSWSFCERVYWVTRIISSVAKNLTVPPPPSPRSANLDLLTNWLYVCSPRGPPPFVPLPRPPTSLFLLRPGFLIRTDLMRIRIQHFFYLRIRIQDQEPWSGSRVWLPKIGKNL
jgi:hypothetical protein